VKRPGEGVAERIWRGAYNRDHHWNGGPRPMPRKAHPIDRPAVAEPNPETPQINTLPNGKAHNVYVRQAHSVKEVEQILGIGHSTLYSLLGTGALKARRLLGRTIILDTDLQAFLAGLPAFGPDAA
jgi:hypothetical protein